MKTKTKKSDVKAINTTIPVTVKVAADKFRKKHGVTMGMLISSSLKSYMKAEKTASKTITA